MARNLTAQVLLAIALGILVGVFWPSAGKAMKPVGDTFINLVKMRRDVAIEELHAERVAGAA